MTSGSLRSRRDQRGSAVLAVEPREEWVQVNLNFSLAASPLASSGRSAAERVPRNLVLFSVKQSEIWVRD